jgi:hypothetical protein
MPNPPSIHKPRSRGTAMTEMVLIIPFIAIILSLLLYLGVGINRLRGANIIDRYEAWRQVGKGPAPAASGAPVPPQDKENSNDGEPGNNLQLVGLFFGKPRIDGSEPTFAHAEYSSERYYPEGALTGQVDLAYQASETTGNLAARHLQTIREMDQNSDSMMIGRKVKITTTFPANETIWSKFEGPYKHQHVRIGNTWRAANGWKIYNSEMEMYTEGGPMVVIEPAVRDTFYVSFDVRMRSINGPGKRLADSIRTFYDRSYIYCGPDLRYRCWYWWN